MKLKSLTGKRKTGKGRIAAVLALAVLLGAAPAIKTDAVLPDLENGEYSVTLKGPDSTAPEYDQLGEANVVVDVYKVASAKELVGYDAYEFDFAGSEFTGAEAKYNELQEASESKPGESIDASMIDAFAQYLEGFVFDNPELKKAASVPMQEDSTTGVVSAKVTMDGAPGLYLLIPRGSDLTDYKYKPENDPEYKATVANGAAKQYIFAPILVSVPNRGFNINEQSKDFKIDKNPDWTYAVGDDNTANTGEWVSDLEVSLKIGQKDLLTKIEIMKNLKNYETMSHRADPATFVFRIEAVDKNDSSKTLFSDVRAITMTGAGESPVTTVEKIPVGSIVTVKEEYAGGDYKSVDTVTLSNTSAISSSENSVSFEAIPDADKGTKLVRATFNNDYNKTWKDGGSVVNRFESTKDATGNIAWSWDADNSPNSHPTTQAAEE